MSFFLGTDTGCYTILCEACSESGEPVYDNSIILGVPEGKLSIRRSEMVFEHIKSLREIFPAGFSDIKAVAASARPRAADAPLRLLFALQRAFGWDGCLKSLWMRFSWERILREDCPCCMH